MPGNYKKVDKYWTIQDVQSTSSSVSVDFAGPLPPGDRLLVLTDDYSRFPEVEIIKSTSAKTVIPNRDNIFSRQGIP